MCLEGLILAVWPHMFVFMLMFPAAASAAVNTIIKIPAALPLLRSSYQTLRLMGDATATGDLPSKKPPTRFYSQKGQADWWNRFLLHNPRTHTGIGADS